MRYLVLLLLGSTCFAGTYSGNLTYVWNGTTRYYDLYVPKNLTKNPALFVMLHGTAVSPSIPPPFDRAALEKLSDQEGFIVLWPISSYTPEGWYWDAYFLDYSFQNDPSDSGYIRALILQTEKQYPVADVFVAGMSSGAFMAHRVGIDSADLVSAVGAASGQLYSEITQRAVAPPSQPISVLMLNGDDDDRVGYCGQNHNWGESSSPSSDVTLDYWAAVSGYTGSLPKLCTNGKPTSGVNGALVKMPGITVQFVREVEVGHEWVAGTEKVMWEFFTANARTAHAR